MKRNARIWYIAYNGDIIPATFKEAVGGSMVIIQESGYLRSTSKERIAHRRESDPPRSVHNKRNSLIKSTSQF